MADVRGRGVAAALAYRVLAAAAAAPPRLTPTPRGNRDSDQGFDGPSGPADSDHPNDRGRAEPGRRTGAARSPRSGRYAGLPAPVANARRHDGQPRDPQGVLP